MCEIPLNIHMNRRETPEEVTMDAKVWSSDVGEKAAGDTSSESEIEDAGEEV